MNTRKIVLAGGPGTGKSSTLNLLREQGYCCLEEISRQVTLDAQREGIDQLFLKEPLLFSEKLLEGRINQYKKADKMATEFCFFDRGIPDVAAYMDYKNEKVPEKFKLADSQYKYDFIFFFPIWEEIYESDNERYESVKEAHEIQFYLKKAYENLGYTLIDLPKLSVKKRVDFILNTISDAFSQ